MKFIEKFTEFFQDDVGGNSSMRLVMLVTCPTIVGVWGFIAIWAILHTEDVTAFNMPDIPWNVVTFGLGIAGIKAYQKGKEGVSAVSSERTTTTTEATVVTPQEPAK